MRDILLASQRPMLRSFLRRRTLLAFDFDGTLAPIVTEQERASLSTSTRRLLAEVARAFPCAVLSGRSLGDLAGRVADIPLRTLVGNHGAELASRNGEPPRPWQIAAWREQLEPQLAGWPGIVLEDKDFSLAVHYRRSPRKREAIEHILRLVAGCAGARMIHGKCVVDLLPGDSPGKAMALERLRTGLDCEAALYVGDDTTDEDVFAAADPARVITVRVGWSKSSRASYYLKRQPDVDSLLELLLTLR